MTKTKIWLIVAASLVAAGLIIFAGVMTVRGWNFNRLFLGSEIRSTSYDTAENFSSISIITDTLDIVFVPAEQVECRVECHELKNVTHTVSVEDGTLKIGVLDTRKWYEMLFSWGSPKMTVYLPIKQYERLTITENTGDIKIPSDFSFKSIDISTSTGNVKSFASATDSITIKTSTGDILVQDVSAGLMSLSVSTGEITAENITLEGNLELKVSTGKTKLSNIKCQTLNSHGNTGDIKLDSVIVSEKMLIERSTGDVKLEQCDAGEIYIETDTGDVTGSLLTDKVFIAQTDTGRVAVPESVTGGKCKIKTSTGDIIITVE